MKFEILIIASLIGVFVTVLATVPISLKEQFSREQDFELNKLRSERIEIYLDSIGQH